MTTKQNLSRADLIRQRRLTQQPGKLNTYRVTNSTGRVYHSDTAYLPMELRKISRGAPSPKAKDARQRHYDIAFSLGNTDVRAPAPSLSVPRLGLRWASGALTLLLIFLLFTMWNASMFTVEAASVRGNERLGETEINAMLGLIGQPIFKAIPAQIEANLRTAFPDLSSVNVRVGIPNHIKIAVVERTPVLAWYQEEALTWIDADGVAFKPRGEVTGLVQVVANGAPPKTEEAETESLFDQVFIQPELVKALEVLAPYTPDGVPTIYDPQYGLGWQDPRGWSVYFGQNTQDIPMKLAVYQNIVDTFTSQGIQPSLISVEHLDAPFYK